MGSYVQQPASGPTLTVDFDGVVDVSRGRQAMNSEDFGSSTGTSRQAASLRTKANIQITFKLVSEVGNSARTKMKALVDRFIAAADEDWLLYLDFGSGEYISYTGKIVSEDGVFQGGTSTTVYMGTLDMNVATESWS